MRADKRRTRERHGCVAARIARIGAGVTHWAVAWIAPAWLHVRPLARQRHLEASHDDRAERDRLSVDHEQLPGCISAAFAAQTCHEHIGGKQKEWIQRSEAARP